MFFNEIDPTKAEAKVLDLEARLRVAMENVAQLTDQYNEVQLAYLEQEPGADDNYRALNIGLTEANNLVSELTGALTAAKNRHKKILAQSNAEHVKKKWDECEVIAAKRLKISKELDKDIQLLSTKLEKLLALGSELYETCPVKLKIGIVDSPITPGNVLYEFRKRMLKHGFKWAANWPWPTHEMPSLDQSIEESNLWVMQHRENLK